MSCSPYKTVYYNIPQHLILNIQSPVLRLRLHETITKRVPKDRATTAILS